MQKQTKVIAFLSRTSFLFIAYELYANLYQDQTVLDQNDGTLAQRALMMSDISDDCQYI